MAISDEKICVFLENVLPKYSVIFVRYYLGLVECFVRLALTP
ncbi:MAG: hypothetical protein AB8U25_06535 [Rickettsiales endosymbiont of Dermacentor nuttalli]